MTASISTPRMRTYAAWALQILLAAAFLAAGLSKLTDVSAMVELFDAVGLGQWFRYVTGVVEVAGAFSSWYLALRSREPLFWAPPWSSRCSPTSSCFRTARPQR